MFQDVHESYGSSEWAVMRCGFDGSWEIDGENVGGTEDTQERKESGTREEELNTPLDDRQSPVSRSGAMALARRCGQSMAASWPWEPWVRKNKRQKNIPPVARA